MNEPCSLCEFIVKTKQYGESENFRAFGCDTCQGIVISHKKHVNTLTMKEFKELSSFILDTFKGEGIIRTHQRKLKHHFHIHVYVEELK